MQPHAGAVRLGTGALLVACVLTLALLAPPGAGASASAGDGAGPAPQPAVPATGAAGVPVYRDPVGYHGPTRVPKLRAVTGPTVTLSAGGSDPHAYVDEAGTAHIVWNEGRGDGADVTVYCRLQRNARHCAVRRELRWDKAYDAADGPEYNVDDGGPRIVRIGDQLLVLSFRYPTTSLKPGDPAPTAGTVVGWLSADGGTTWTDAAILGRNRLGQLVVVGTDVDPLVVNVAEDPYCPPPGSSGQVCVSSLRSAGYDDSAATLDPDGATDYSPSIVAQGTRAVMAMGACCTIPGARIRVRRWNGADPVTDPGNWTTSAPISGAQPELASGPAGTYLLQAAAGGEHPLQVRRLHTGDDGVMSAGPAQSIAPASDDRHEIVEDAEGRLLVAYANPGRTELRVVTREPGSARFGRPAVVLHGRPGQVDIGQHDLAVTDDGGGFVVANRTGGWVGPGQVVAAPVGSLAPTGKKGLGDLPGGGNVTCTRVDFGSFGIDAESGCFFKGTGSRKDVVVTRNAVDLNGLEIVPTPGSSLIIDPEKLTLDTIGQARVLLRNGDATIELFKGRIARNLAGLRPGDRIFEFPRELFQADVLGFDVASGMPVELTADGVRIPLDVKLPAAMGGFTGHAVLRGVRGRGLSLGSLHIAMGPITLGVATFGAKVDWEAGESWTGSGTLGVPAGGTLHARVAFDHGDFVSADFDYEPSPPLVIGPFVYLTSVDGGLHLRPDVQVRAGIHLGAPLPIRGAYPIRVEGQATMTFPDNGPARFRIDEALQLFFMKVAHGYFEFYTDGYAQFRGQTDLDLGPLHGGAHVEGFVDAAGGAFGADLQGDLDICANLSAVGLTKRFCAGVQGNEAVSSRGFAVCARINPPDPFGGVSAGIASRWEDFDPVALANPTLLAIEIVSDFTLDCDAGAYTIPPPRVTPRIALTGRARARTTAAASSFAIAPGLRSATLRIPGQGGAPAVRVLAPSGTVLVDGTRTSHGARVVTLDGADATWVLLPHPGAGTYTVTPRPGSVPLGTIRLAPGYRGAAVHAHLVRPKGHRSGPQHKVRVAYRIAHLGHGQTVQFRETGRFGTRVVRTVHASGRHAFTFSPVRLRGRARTVEAVLLRQGLTRKVVRVGSFRAPGPAPAGRVGGLHVRRHGSHLLIRFRPAAHAVRTVVRVRGDAGSRFLRTLEGRRHVLRLDGFRWDHRIRVVVRARAADGHLGKARSATLPRRRHHQNHHGHG